jgi:diguanylate cyclase (GGDEF)-like protein/PAS domain S-box-containing protein/putative nucleotidyltransferase with HDIG domain
MKQVLSEKLSPSTLKKINEIFTNEISSGNYEDKKINHTHIIDAEYFCSDGSIVCAPMHISFMRDEGSNTIGLLCTSVGTTDTHEEQVRLQASEISYRRLFESSGDGILILDAETGIIEDINPYLIKMLGCPKEDLAEKMIWEIAAFRDIVANKENFLELQSKEHIRYENIPLIAADGRQIDVEFVSNVYMADNKKVIQCSIRDISDRIRMENEINRERSMAKIYFDTANIMFIVINRDETVKSLNNKACEILGINKNDIIGMNWFDNFVPKSSVAEIRSVFDKIIKGEIKALRFYENPIVTSKGQERLISWHNSVLQNETGNIIGIICSGNDITGCRNAEKALMESEAKYSSYIKNAPNGVFVFDETGNFLEVNKAASDITGYSTDELLHMKIPDIIAKESLDEGGLHIEKIAEHSTSSGSIHCKHKDGSNRWLAADAVKLPSGRYLGFAKDITEEKHMESELLHLGYHDKLTGLYNRRFFEEELRRLDTERNLPISIVMGDVNGLKLINDSFGHATGDKVLIRTAKLIKKACRSDEIVARLGGDEFIIILPKTNRIKSVLVIDRIKSLVSKEKIAGIKLSISFGVDTKDNTDQKISEVYANAENLMYRHKIFEHLSMRSETIDIIMNALFEKSSRESHHSNRVSRICESFALKLGASTDEAKQIRLAGLVHDIGKISIDEKILNKTKPLDSAEWVELRKHPEAGWRILSSAKEFLELAQFILEHHERWDGTGYPKGLKGIEISKEARIIAICDSFDAMTSKRNYKKERSTEDALIEIKKGSGTQFDPDLVDAFISQESLYNL